MKVSASIELIMQLAGYEAMAGRFGEIEPEHLLAAILKFSELPVNKMDQLAPGAVSVKQLSAEIDAVKKELTDRSIDSTQVRRKLRTQKGRGTGSPPGGQMHRAQASREIFDVAAKLADDAGSDAMGAKDLLDALLIAPTRTIEQVLGDAVGVKAKKHAETPLLDQHGNDLAPVNAQATMALDSSRKAECKALIRALAQDVSKSVLLISDNDSVVHAIVTTIAQTTTNKKAPQEFKGKRIKDLTRLESSSSTKQDVSEQLDQILSEAADAQDVILFLPTIGSGQSSTEVKEWADHLKSSLQKRSVQCICRVSPSAYRRWIQKDLEWKRLTKAMWICNEIIGNIPSEL